MAQNVIQNNRCLTVCKGAKCSESINAPLTLALLTNTFISKVAHKYVVHILLVFRKSTGSEVA